MEAIETAAFISVGRACGFAALAIFCVMAGTAFAPAESMRIGGFLCLGLTGFLLFRGITARKWPYKRTETWLILAEDKRPPAKIAQRIIGETLRETFLWFAKQASLFAIAFLAAAAVLNYLGFGGWNI